MIKKNFPLVNIENISLMDKNKVVLCLENSYFHIFKVKIENVINKEDRILKIEDYLEIIFPKYSSSDFILNYEFLEKNDEYEYLIVYLLDLKKLEQNNININKLKVISIIPSFFKAREFNNINFYNFDINANSLVISKYSSAKLEEIDLFQSEVSFNIDDKQEFSYSNIINTFLANIQKDFLIVFTGNKVNIDELDLENKNYNFFDIEEIDFRKYPNFLPKKMQQKYILYSMNFKYLLSIFILTILSAIICIFLYIKTDGAEKKLENLEAKSSLLEEENESIRNELTDLEKNWVELEEHKKELEKTDFQISDFLNELKHIIPKKVLISSIEYDGKKILSLIGITQNLSNINLFLSNIQNSKNITLENYDYILKKENEIEFKFELSFN